MSGVLLRGRPASGSRNALARAVLDLSPRGRPRGGPCASGTYVLIPALRRPAPPRSLVALSRLGGRPTERKHERKPAPSSHPAARIKRGRSRTECAALPRPRARALSLPQEDPLALVDETGPPRVRGPRRHCHAEQAPALRCALPRLDPRPSPLLTVLVLRRARPRGAPLDVGLSAAQSHRSTAPRVSPSETATAHRRRHARTTAEAAAAAAARTN